MDAVSTIPAIQCHWTHANLIPAIGKKAVNSKVNIEAAMTQWNNRAARECLGILAGKSGRAASILSVSMSSRFRCGDSTM